jgi:hypothetical protein
LMASKYADCMFSLISFHHASYATFKGPTPPGRPSLV